jgi:hypothetical protein
MPKAALLTPRFRIRLGTSFPNAAINSLCEEAAVVATMSKMRRIMPHAVLSARLCRRRFVSARGDGWLNLLARAGHGARLNSF